MNPKGRLCLFNYAIAFKLHNPESALKLVDKIEKAILARLEFPSSFERFQSNRRRKHVSLVLMQQPESWILRLAKHVKKPRLSLRISGAASVKSSDARGYKQPYIPSCPAVKNAMIDRIIPMTP